MPHLSKRVLPIRQDIAGSDAVREIVESAYNLWLSSGFRGCSPEGALLIILQEATTKTSTGLFVVTGRDGVPPLPSGAYK